MVLGIFIVLFTFISMEAFTWFTHKYVMHGFLWFLHKDHHDKSSDGAFEKNDAFFVIFAIPTIALLYLGVYQDFSAFFYIGIGIFLYGMAYFFVHDIFVHQRIKIFNWTRSSYLLALRRAHKQHHKHIDKEKGECFGFLFVPLKYLKMYTKKQPPK